MSKNEIIEFLSTHKEEFERDFGLLRIGIFGSYAREENIETSDIDIVVELEKPDLFYLIGIKQAVEEAFGKKVDIVRLRDKMNNSLRSRIERDAIYV